MSGPQRPRTSSRAPASRPRRIAGRGTTPVPQRTPVTAEADLAEEPAVTEEPVTANPTVDLRKPAEPSAPSGPSESSEPEEPAPSRADGLFAGARVTVALLVAIVVLTAATLAMAVFLWVSDDESAPASRPAEGEIAVPDDRPIQLSMGDAQAAASAAAEAATAAFSRRWDEYDAQVDEAARTMTAAYAEEFRTTTDDAKAGVVEGKLEIQSRVVAQSVVRANTSQVQALLFLDQYTTKPGKGGGTTVSPYRVLVTMVHTDGGWLVSDIDTK